MPCEKCKNGKVKWGKTGSCEYDSIAECEEANKDYYEELKNTRIVELVIEDDNQELAIDAISLVTAPAIEQDFVYFGYSLYHHSQHKPLQVQVLVHHLK